MPPSLKAPRSGPAKMKLNSQADAEKLTETKEALQHQGDASGSPRKGLEEELRNKQALFKKSSQVSQLQAELQRSELENKKLRREIEDGMLKRKETTNSFRNVAKEVDEPAMLPTKRPRTTQEQPTTLGLHTPSSILIKRERYFERILAKGSGDRG
ncbi:uncharacterized protein PAC_18993 [Phialocephala subalpina]|uniref:Uncharacterized protein n=1 Tax=Phialocephala subalpina TaxID=576137 RepID=A0A1L7XVL5_9HELO|nr:uncharacterized protein PAC_18993 [Phialocephala subalpina]